MNSHFNRTRNKYNWRGKRGNSRQRESNRENQTRNEQVVPVDNSSCPYKGWCLYFPNQKYDEESDTSKHLITVIKYFNEKKLLDDIKCDSGIPKSFLIDAQDLFGNIESWPSLRDDLRNSPKWVIAIVGLVVHHLLEKKHDENDYEQEKMPFIYARFVNVEPILCLKDLHASCFGKLVSIKGTVVRAGSIKPICTEMLFKCNNCAELQTVQILDGKYTLPTTCPSIECRGQKFIADLNSKLTTTINCQSIKIQELILDDQKEAGRIPRTIECELTNDLVDTCSPGDTVIVTGIVEKTSDIFGGRQNSEKSLFLLYIHVNSLTNCKNTTNSSQSKILNRVDQQFSLDDLYAIRAIGEKDNLFPLIIASLCPAIYGHEIMKAGLVLALFGGTQKYAQDKNRIPIRGDPHVLVVGDPGLGKSQILQACANVTARGVYVSGNTSSVAGLTVTVCKGSSDSDSALEAGALVLADQGSCCIDEFDKMTTQHQALLEAMEQQSISIAKAGIICSLPARTSVLAAANPIGGHYNNAKTVVDNLKIKNALLSRFDLVFIIIDKPDKEMDDLLSKHVMAMHGSRSTTFTPFQSSIQQTSQECSQSTTSNIRQSLMKRLLCNPDELANRIQHSLLRKYISYARKYVHPKISPEAAKVLQEFYLTLRKDSQRVDGTPITSRQLESLIRLTEARAKIELREETTVEDAKDVIDIMKCSMMDAYSDNLNNLSLNRSQHGSGMSGRSKGKRFIGVLCKIANETGNNLFTLDDLRKVATDLNIQVNFQDFIQSLNNQNCLLKKGARVYQLLSTNF